MMINELIEQIGRERLEFLSKAENLPEVQKLAQFALVALDAKPVIYEAEINGVMSSVTKLHYDDCKRLGVPVRELYTATPAASVPDGWKMVPLEPTQRMIDAHTEGMVSGGATRAYRDMLAAAPAPGGEN